MPMNTISSVKKLSGKIALVRIDTNVPLRGRKITDDSRLRESLSTVRFLERHGAHVILICHLGRPQGKRLSDLSLKPIGYAFGRLLRRPVKVLPLSVGVDALKREAKRGVVMLENIRFEKGEDENSLGLARRLAALGDIFVNEAFSVSHRAAGSLVAITKFLPSYAGLHLAEEVAALAALKKGRSRPMVALVGGAKVADKLVVIKSLLPKLSYVMVGGAVANTLMSAKKQPVGKSLVDKTVIKQARSLIRQAGKKLVLPVDVIVDKVGTKKREVTWRTAGKVMANERIVDLGTGTTQLYAAHIKRASSVLWSGTLGLAEEHEWAHSSIALGRLVASRARRRCYVVVGGGDTAAFFHQHELAVDYMSSGGGAMLDFLAGAKLPGLAALGYR